MVRFQVKKRAVKTKIRPQWETQQAWERDTDELQEETAVIYEAVKVSPSRASLLCFLLLFLLLICFDRVEHSCVPSRHIIFRALKPSQPRKVAEAVHLRRSSGRFTSTGASVFTPFSWSEDLLFLVFPFTRGSLRREAAWIWYTSGCSPPPSRCSTKVTFQHRCRMGEALTSWQNSPNFLQTLL